MLLRLHIVFRVLRDYSTIYTERKIIERIPGYSPAMHPVFNSFLTTKTFFHQHPISFIMIWMFSTVLVLGYIVYIFEREIRPPLWSFPTGIYLIFLCMVTGWAADVYDRYDPLTSIGKACCVAAAIAGLFLFALLVDYVHVKFRVSRFQELALDWVIQNTATAQHRNEAAKLIQLLWKHRLGERQWRNPMKMEPALVIRKWNLRTKFNVQFQKQLAIVRHLRHLKIRRDMEMSEKSEYHPISHPELDKKIREANAELKRELLADIAELFDRKLDERWNAQPARRPQSE